LIYIIPWYLTITLIGWLIFPLVYRLMPGLPDRGYTASRTLGLLLWSYLFWLMASLGFLHNEIGGLLLPLTLLIGLSLWMLRRTGLAELRQWLSQKRALVLVTETLFLLAFIGWAVVRAYNPEAIGTEKPMELAFINAILNSPTFPPHDPWLSGHAISYYYFGYVMMAMLAKFTGTSGAVAFNLGLSLVFALSAVGVYGLVYNLLVGYSKGGENSQNNLSLPTSSRASASFSALLGPIFVLLVSNLEGFLHSLHNRGVLWQRDAEGGLVSSFWTWLDIKDLNLPPAEPFSWVPTRFWWWWRGSRVLQDYDLAGNVKEIIDEFPFFSYLLGDLHPHVLAMPFAFLTMSLALNLFFGGARGKLDWFHRELNLRTLAWISVLGIPFGIVALVISANTLNLLLLGLSVAALSVGGLLLVRLRQSIAENGLDILLRTDLGSLPVGRKLDITPSVFLISAIVLGGMFFLNAWDFPLYVALFAGAYALIGIYDKNKTSLSALKDFIWLGLALGICGGLLYLPFYLGFASQAGGPLPNMIYLTRGAHLWVMFGTLLIPIFAFPIYLLKKSSAARNAPKALKITLGVFIAMWLASLIMTVVIVSLPQVGDFYLGVIGAVDRMALFSAAVSRRFANFGGWLTLAALFTLIMSIFLRLLNNNSSGDSNPGADAEIREPGSPDPNDQPTFNLPFRRADLFALLLIFFGALIVLGPEFFYLRDQFGWRMNTIFKFYFQAWLLWGVAAAYGSLVLLKMLRGAWGWAFRIILILVLAAGLVYPLFSLPNKTGGFQTFEGTLDSSIYLERESPDEMAAIRWLQAAPPGIIAEAVPATGGSYTQFARQATLSGQPNVLGWVGHESQWRGGGQAMGSRQADLELLYCTRDWQIAKQILDLYNIRYIVVGPLERSVYQPNTTTCPAGLVESKFTASLPVAFQQGGLTIYEYSGDE